MNPIYIPILVAFLIWCGILHAGGAVNRRPWLGYPVRLFVYAAGIFAFGEIGSRMMALEKRIRNGGSK